MVNNVNHGCVIMLIMVNNIWLVVSNMFYVPFHIWLVILPIDVHSIIFQYGHIAPPYNHH